MQSTRYVDPSGYCYTTIHSKVSLQIPLSESSMYYLFYLSSALFSICFNYHLFYVPFVLFIICSMYHLFYSVTICSMYHLFYLSSVLYYLFYGMMLKFTLSLLYLLCSGQTQMAPIPSRGSCRNPPKSSMVLNSDRRLRKFS